MTEPCPHCAQMREERDAALNALAAEREKLNALVLAQPSLPLRYLAADAVNDRLRRFPLPQRILKALVGKFVR